MQGDLNCSVNNRGFKLLLYVHVVDSLIIGTPLTVDYPEG